MVQRELPDQQEQQVLPAQPDQLGVSLLMAEDTTCLLYTSCSLVGDFEAALQKVMDQYHPDRIIIEPSGVGKLSDVIAAVRTLDNPEMELNSFVTVADVTKCKMYMKNFGEFYNNQIEHAKVIVSVSYTHLDVYKRQL